jgi:exosortase F-associated protein
MKNLKSTKTRMAILLLILALAGIRGFEEGLFYDPFLIYFKNDYLQIPWPEFDLFWLSFSLSIRFFINSFLSIFIIHLVFRDLMTTKFASMLYFIIFLFLFFSFLVLMNLGNEQQNFLLFYLRRFLIHPVLLILFLPAFYFQKLQTRAK